MNALCAHCNTDRKDNMRHDWLGGEAILRCVDCGHRCWEAECAYKDELVRRTKAKTDWCKYGEQCAKIQVEIDGEKDFAKQKKLNSKLAEARRKQALAEQEVGK